MGVNLQYDGTLEVGLRIALDHGYNYAVTLDADGQHDSGDIPRLVAALHATASELDTVVLQRRAIRAVVALPVGTRLTREQW